MIPLFAADVAPPAPLVAVPLLPVWFELAVMTVNCLFGAAVARSRNIGIYGTIVAGLMVGLGGGIVRDLLLNQEPVAISQWYYIPAGIIGALIGAAFFGGVLRSPRRFALLQGITLGFLVTIGAQKALSFDTPLISAIVLGIITATFGALVADVSMGYRATIVRQPHWIGASIAFGAIAFVLLSYFVNFWLAVVVGVAICATLRFVSQVRQWPTPKWPGEIADPEVAAG